MVEKLKLKSGKGDFELRKAFFNMYSRGLLNQSCSTKILFPNENFVYNCLASNF